MKKNLLWLLATLLLVAVIVGLHNLSLDDQAEFSFGFCDTSVACQGIELGDWCLGIEQQSTSCVSPVKNDDKLFYRRIEAECGLQAQKYCQNSSIEGKAWADLGSYQNQTCRAWSQQDERIDLLDCKQITKDITDYARVK